ncbi:MAG: DUF1295 domain-containing protein [Opitutaceae bacterium]|nr:DUF1295 domain-containing protein [Opitutaceae bacterium]
MNATAISLLALAGLCAAFAGIYVLARRIDNYGIVDVAWSYAFGLLAMAYAFLGDGWLPRRAVVAVLVVAWSARLGTHLWRRVAAHHPEEDGRYRRMRENWSRRFHATMFGFFQLQALSVFILGLPFLLAMRHVDSAFHPLEIAGIVVFLAAIAGESAADAQLAAFKRDPANRGAVCTRGLWGWSRHPNYFFEWLVWVAFALIALPAPAGWLGLIAPATILFLLLRVTGIPATEEQAVRSKGEAYRRYQRSTSVFIPWPPRARAIPASST